MGRTLPTRAMRLYEDGAVCSCHLSAPCSFCESLEEEEYEALLESESALRALWAQWENENNEE